MPLRERRHGGDLPAGHGKAVDGKYNFLPADLVLENEDNIRKGGLTQEKLEGHLRRFGSGRTLLVLDTCHAGAMTESRGIEETFAIDNLMRQSGQVTLAASRSDELAFQDRGDEARHLHALAARRTQRRRLRRRQGGGRGGARQVPRAGGARPQPKADPERTPPDPDALEDANAFPLVPVLK